MRLKAFSILPKALHTTRYTRAQPLARSFGIGNIGKMSALQDTKGGDWKGIAENYKNMTTEVGKKPIGVMLERANALLPFSQADGVLDNGCGPGPV